MKQDGWVTRLCRVCLPEHCCPWAGSPGRVGSGRRQGSLGFTAEETCSAKGRQVLFPRGGDNGC